jgi:hypothetical protein
MFERVEVCAQEAEAIVTDTGAARQSAWAAKGHGTNTSGPEHVTTISSKMMKSLEGSQSLLWRREAP